MKKLFLLLLSSLLLYSACPSAPAPNGDSGPADFLEYVPSNPDRENSVYQPETMADKTAFQFFADEGLTVGWNLGNSLDGFSGDRVGGETNWGNPAINQKLMDGIKAAGVNVIRIPVTWMGHIGAAPDHRVAESRLKRVAEVVDMAHNAGLKVIINLHHDGSTSSTTKEDGWLSVGKASRDKEEYAKITHKYVRLWAQIACYFKNYGDWLIFESMNEIHDGGWGWSPAFKSNPSSQMNIVNEWNQLFTSIVRSTGGNNATRYLMVPSYCSAPEALDPAGRLGDTSVGRFFKLPTDTVSGRQIVTFHYYKPDNVGLGSNTDPKSNWGTDTDKSNIDNAFKPFKAAYIDRDIPVVIGESGATRQVYSDAAKTAQARASRLAYLSHVYGTAKKYGLVPVYWDNGATGDKTSETFGLFNRTTGEPASPEFRECVEAIINAVK
jgi:endoglucanase